jgi:ATP/maltotriose-dependent transcriptional regulator MalT
LNAGSPTASPVAAKLARPRIDDVVLRPDTLADFRRATRRRLSLVCAPAGYGKTTVAAAAIERLGLDSIWYKLDVLDHDPVVFVASLTEALRERFADFGDAIRERLRTTAETPFPIEHMQAMFVKECERRIAAMSISSSTTTTRRPSRRSSIARWTTCWPISRRACVSSCSRATIPRSR